ncbi:MAG: LapA family protein [Syntrophales bacterium]|nr:LapA family protein [Syntrophales bacterium]MDD5643808.1 LapA family protein [Syntrophales bacterium]
MRFFKIIFSSLLAVLGIIFIIQNRTVMEHSVQLKLNLYFHNLQSAAIPLWILILFTFFLGVFTASLYGLYELFKQRQNIRTLKHNLEIVSQELKRASAAAASEIPAQEPEIVHRSE